ncbi:hypothetical protein E2C01_024499 [Portunus trituberculatus]|uniref:Uncharacterized protein n=1 Tax=Portunus trituberculatus TaxID=210409 RepID=A0A5B7EDB4_PORTR|nr:hypothetical protein [Portunus trituberculatus]
MAESLLFRVTSSRSVHEGPCGGQATRERRRLDTKMFVGSVRAAGDNQHCFPVFYSSGDTHSRFVSTLCPTRTPSEVTD